MNTITTTFDSVQLVCPSEKFMWPHPTFKGFPSACGAGKLGDYLIPDTLWGLNVSPACYIHDQMWSLAEPSWSDFHASNALLFVNCAFIIQARSANFFIRDLRIARAATYLLAVSTLGAPIFWSLKEKQGFKVEKPHSCG